MATKETKDTKQQRPREASKLDTRLEGLSSAGYDRERDRAAHEQAPRDEDAARTADALDTEQDEIAEKTADASPDATFKPSGRGERPE